MSARRRRSTAAAIALTAAITTGAMALLTGCGPEAAKATTAPTATVAGSPSGAPSGAAPSDAPTAAPTATPTATPTGAAPTAAPSATPTGAAPTNKPTSKPTSAPAPVVPVRVNGTGHSGLTISNGTDFVLMNGTSVDFHTAVRDLSWSPDGSKAAFIDGSGNLAVANPDGSGRVVIAKNPGGQTWAHPAWQVTAYDAQYHFAAKNNLFFTATQNGASRLETVSAAAPNGTPAPLTLGNYSGENVPALPQTGNTWANTGGAQGTAVYANSADGNVYVRDDYLRQQGSALTPGSEPALSPSGDEIVFVRSSAGHDHLFEQSLGGQSGSAKDLTPNATTDYTEPAFSHDGKTIAARTANGVVTLPADGSKAPTLVSGYTGLPAYRG